MITGNSTKNHNIEFALYTVVCLSLIVISIKFPQVNNSFQAVIVNITTPVLQLIQKPSQWVTVAEGAVSEHVSVYEKNKKLKLEIADKQRLSRDFSIIYRENKELRGLLNMVDKVKGDAIAARVISDKKSAFNHTVLINLGQSYGLKKGQVAMNEEGLVGRVLEVYDEASRILLLTDYASRIPVKILEVQLRGIVRGTNGKQLELVFTEYEKIKIKKGMVVVTTGAGGLFMEGLPVGVIEKVGKHIYIKPDVNFKNLDLISIQRQAVRGIL